ncbi:hypothetical protein TBR22_A01400 [Luteitalea sp. TBR-22]|uniref:glycosyltransferase n=1 Tax=Luteitalea sp. TBR-22 TaxID=2802971 RepID=UPI001AFA35B6|nr:glycosyltransferase [Luteitalea sp. TBR-22]BCS30939.1 hypothetical protein TBR22_A01400 [Luteitalea sp. TBR-22]
MRVLLTAASLDARTGAELYVYDVATGLLARGHRPVAFAPQLGHVAEHLRDATVPVARSLDDLGEPPDLIHGQDNHVFLTALLRFPGVPGVRVCHGWEDERPTRFPRIRRYVAVDDTVRDRMTGEWGLPATAVSTVRNFADLRRFVPRAPLPSSPSRALLFSNYAAAHAAVVRQACLGAGLPLDVAGSSVGVAADHPEALLGQYDVVFAKGRCAIEAMAVGAAVILCDASGAGPMVTTTNIADLHRVNFGLRALSSPLSPAVLAQELARYDAGDAARVSAHVRAVASMDDAVDRLVEVYEQAWHDQAASPAPADDDLRAAAAYLTSLGPRLSWTQSTRAITYQMLRRAYFRLQRVPVARRLLAGRRGAQRLQRRLRP